ncbi:MAG: hypothetical protein ACLF0P_07690 [Thermoanaerobaculia bacterium]
MAPSDPRRIMDVLKRYRFPGDEAERILEESVLAAARHSRRWQQDLETVIATIVEARCREYVARTRTVEEGELQDDDEPSGS